MDITIIKSEINKALSKSHAKDCTYDDLFNKTFEPQDPTYPSRVHNNTIEEFETEVQDFINQKKYQSFVIYIQHDDANFLGADCDWDVLEYLNGETDPNTYHWFKYEDITIYVVID